MWISVSLRWDGWMDLCKFESFCGKSDVWMDRRMDGRIV